MSRPSDLRRSSLEKATAQYAQLLDEAAGYLSARGVRKETAAAARLGVVRDPVPGHELFTGRLSIPYLTRAGVVDMKFRCIDDHDCKAVSCPKYLALPNSDSHLYNVASFFAGGDVIAVCEGELDALVLFHEVGVPAVGCPGVQRWESHFSRCFSDYAKVIIPADGDTAGKDFAGRLSRELGPAAVPVFLPDGHDVNSLFLAEGKDGVLTRLGLAE